MKQHKKFHNFYTIYFFEEVAQFATKMFLKTNLSPNHITLLRLPVTLISSLFFFFSDYKYYLIGAVLFYIARIMDCVDGRVARQKGKGTVYGAYMDRVLDDLGDCVMFTAIAGGLLYKTGNVFYFFLLAANLTFLYINESSKVNKIVSFNKIIKSNKGINYSRTSMLPFSDTGRAVIIIGFMIINQPAIILWFFALFGNLFWLSRLILFRSELD